MYGWLNLFIAIFLGMTFHHSVRAQEIAIVKSMSLKAYEAPITNFKEAFKNATITIYDLKGELTNGPSILADIKNRRPALIFTLGLKASHMVISEIKDIPVIFAMVLNWRKYQLKQQNSTGISLDIPVETLFTQFKLVIPSISKVGVIYNKESSQERVDEAKKYGEKVGVELVSEEIKTDGEVLSAFEKLASRIDALWMVPDPVAVTVDSFNSLVAKCSERKIPFLVFSENFVRAGAFLSVSPNYFTIGGQAAIIAKRILLDNISPDKIPVSAPIGTELIVNQTVGRQLEIKIDPGLYESIDKLLGEEE